MDGNNKQSVDNSKEKKLDLDIEERLGNLSKKLYIAYNGIHQKNNNSDSHDFFSRSQVPRGDSEFNILLKEVESQWQSIYKEKESEREFLSEQAELLDQREFELEKARTAFEESKMTFENEKIEFLSIINSEWELIKQEKDKFFHWRDRIINEILGKHNEMKEYITFLSSEKAFLEENIAKSRNELKALKRNYDRELKKLKDQSSLQMPPTIPTVEVQPAMLYLAETNNELLTIQKMLLQLRRELHLRDESLNNTEITKDEHEQTENSDQSSPDLIQKEITSELTKMFEESRAELEKEWEQLRADQEKFDKEKKEFSKIKTEFENISNPEEGIIKKFKEPKRIQKLDYIVESLNPVRREIEYKPKKEEKRLGTVLDLMEPIEESTSIFDSLQKSAMEAELQKVLQPQEISEIWEYVQTDITDLDQGTEAEDLNIQKD
ncbi:MAG: hypothetical protein ACFFG0_45585 [Candidatus Thorarchaeota archaeon]